MKKNVKKVAASNQKKKQEEKKNRKALLLLLLLIFLIALGIGYAVLSQQLSISNTVNYGSMKWDVGFSTAVNNGGTVGTTPTVSDDKKTVDIACNLGTSTAAETCIVKSTIKNDSTFDIILDANPKIVYEDYYISSVVVTWLTTTTNTGMVKKNDVIPAGASYDIQIAISTKELTEEMLPSTATSIPVTTTLSWMEDRD